MQSEERSHFSFITPTDALRVDGRIQIVVRGDGGRSHTVRYI